MLGNKYTPAWWNLELKSGRGSGAGGKEGTGNAEVGAEWTKAEQGVTEAGAEEGEDEETSGH